MLQLIGVIANGVISTLFLTWGIISFAISNEAFGFVNAIVSIVLGSVGLLSAIPKGDDELWEYTMEDVDVSGTKLQGMLPQAIMDMDNLVFAKTLKPAAVELLKKLL